MNYPTPDLTPDVAAAVRAFDRHCRVFGQDQLTAAGDAAIALLDTLEEAKAAGELPLGWQGPSARMWALPDRDSWLRARQLLGTVGGSDVGPIVYGAYDGLWGFARPDLRKSNNSMSEGHWWEPVILRRYSYITGAELIDLPEHTVHLRWGWAHVSLDALAQPADGRRGFTAVDAKWVFRVDQAESQEAYDLEHHVWGKSCDVDPSVHPCDLPMPPYILGQSVLIMAVLGVDTCDIAALMPSYQLRVYTVWRHARRERAVLSLCRDAWERFRLRGETPPSDQTDICLQWYAEQRRRSGRLCREAAPNDLELVESLRQAREDRKAAQDREKALRAEVIAQMGTHYRLTAEGKTLATIDSRGAVRTYTPPPGD